VILGYPSIEAELWECSQLARWRGALSKQQQTKCAVHDEFIY
jgi:hypothetical protein